MQEICRWYLYNSLPTVYTVYIYISIYIYHYISSSFDSPGRVTKATPNLDAVDRALEELQRGLLEIDHVLAGPGPRLGLGSPRKSIGSPRKNGGFNGKIESIQSWRFQVEKSSNFCAEDFSLTWTKSYLVQYGGKEPCDWVQWGMVLGKPSRDIFYSYLCSHKRE